MLTTQEKEKALEQVLSSIKGLPTLPETFAKINAMVADPDTTAKQIGKVISSDPPIAAKTLKVVNSAFYGFPTRISTITHAIVILGFATVRSIVLSSTILQAFGKRSRSPQFDRAKFWQHSVGCGAAAKVIARHCGQAKLEEFFIAGLLHDVGKIIIDQYLHDEFMMIVDKVAQENCLIRDAEEAVLGTDHAQIGAHLFNQWKLPEMLVRAVANHHTPHQAGDYIPQASILHVADVFTRALMLGSGGDRKIPQIHPKAWQELGLRAEDLPELFEQIWTEAENAMVFLDFVT